MKITEDYSGSRDCTLSIESEGSVFLNEYLYNVISLTQTPSSTKEDSIRISKAFIAAVADQFEIPKGKITSAVASGKLAVLKSSSSGVYKVSVLISGPVKISLLAMDNIWKTFTDNLFYGTGKTN